MQKKPSYRSRNWPAYNAAVIGRGSLTLWVDEAAIRRWRYTGPRPRGAQYPYTATAIACVLTVRAVYPLAWRAAGGLARAGFALRAVSLPVPSYRPVARRAADLSVALGALPRATALHLGVDASGGKGYGEGGGKGRGAGCRARRRGGERARAGGAAPGGGAPAGAGGAGGWGGDGPRRRAAR